MLNSFADQPDGANYEAVQEDHQAVDAKTTLKINLVPAGGYVARFTH